MDILATLNPAQKEAAEAIKGPVLILAGPGSGKTIVITHRVAYLVKACGIGPHNIMAVTFTNKAAREMKERLQQLLGQAIEALDPGHFSRPFALAFFTGKAKLSGLARVSLSTMRTTS